MEEFTKDEKDANLLAILTTAAGNEDFIRHFDPHYDMDRKLNKYSPDGIYFRGRGNAGHFICKANGQEINSYNNNQQISGRNGFCQTFAIMNYHYKGNIYTKNVQEATKEALIFLRKNANLLVPSFRQAARELDLFADLYNRTDTRNIREYIDRLYNNRNFRRILQTEQTYI